jgi:hypothetical protein
MGRSMSVTEAHTPLPIGVKPLEPGKDRFPAVPEIASARARRLYEEVVQLETAAMDALNKAYELNGKLESVRQSDARAAGEALRSGAEPPERHETALVAEIEEAKRQAAAWQQAQAAAQRELLEVLREEADDLAAKATARIDKALDRALRKAVELQEELVALHRAQGDRLYAATVATYGDSRIRTPMPIFTEERAANGERLPVSQAAQAIVEALARVRETD